MCRNSEPTHIGNTCFFALSHNIGNTIHALTYCFLLSRLKSQNKGHLKYCKGSGKHQPKLVYSSLTLPVREWKEQVLPRVEITTTHLTQC